MNDIARFLSTPRYILADLLVMAIIFALGLCGGAVLALAVVR